MTGTAAASKVRYRGNTAGTDLARAEMSERSLRACRRAVAGKAAHVLTCMLGWAHLAGHDVRDLLDATEAKMSVKNARTWRLQLDGTWQHAGPSLSTPSTGTTRCGSGRPYRLLGSPQFAVAAGRVYSGMHPVRPNIFTSNGYRLAAAEPDFTQKKRI